MIYVRLYVRVKFIAIKGINDFQGSHGYMMSISQERRTEYSCSEHDTGTLVSTAYNSEHTVLYSVQYRYWLQNR